MQGGTLPWRPDIFLNVDHPADLALPVGPVHPLLGLVWASEVGWSNFSAQQELLLDISDIMQSCTFRLNVCLDAEASLQPTSSLTFLQTPAHHTYGMAPINRNEAIQYIGTHYPSFLPFISWNYCLLYSYVCPYIANYNVLPLQRRTQCDQ